MITKPESKHEVFILASISSAARKDMEKLDHQDRHRVAAAVAKPVPKWRSQGITSLKKFGVFHFDASDTLRVSFRKVSGKQTIIHVGNHDDFDHFCDHYNGNRIDGLQSLVEWLKPYQKSVEKSGLAVDQTAVVARDDFILFQELFANISRGIMKQEFEKDGNDLNAAFNLLDEKLEQFAETFHHWYSKNRNGIETLKSELEDHVVSLTQGVLGNKEAREQELQNIRKELASNASELDGFVSAAAQTVEQIHEQQNSLDHSNLEIRQILRDQRALMDREMSELRAAKQELVNDLNQIQYDLMTTKEEFHNQLAKQTGRRNEAQTLAVEKIAAMEAQAKENQKRIMILSNRVHQLIGALKKTNWLSRSIRNIGKWFVRTIFGRKTRRIQKQSA